MPGDGSEYSERWAAVLASRREGLCQRGGATEEQGAGPAVSHHVCACHSWLKGLLPFQTFVAGLLVVTASACASCCRWRVYDSCVCRGGGDGMKLKLKQAVMHSISSSLVEQDCLEVVSAVWRQSWPQGAQDFLHLSVSHLNNVGGRGWQGISSCGTARCAPSAASWMSKTL